MADQFLDQKIGVPVVLPALTDPTSYTPSNFQGFGTPTNVFLEWRQSLTKTLISGSFLPSTGTAVEVQMGLPAGQTVGTFAGASGTFIVGKWSVETATGNLPKQGVVLATTGQTYLKFAYDDYTNAVSPTNPRTGTNIALPNRMLLDGEIVVPIAEFQALGGYRAYGAGQALAARLGLVMGGTVPGKVDGTAIAAGMIGETITASVTDSSIGTAIASYASLALTAGVWRITYEAIVEAITNATAGSVEYAFCEIYNVNNTSQVTGTARSLFIRNPSGSTGVSNIAGCLVASATLPINTSTTFQLRAKRIDATGVGSAAIYNNGNGQSQFYATRIG